MKVDSCDEAGVVEDSYLAVGVGDPMPAQKLSDPGLKRARGRPPAISHIKELVKHRRTGVTLPP
jgi:hypothetical protein